MSPRGAKPATKAGRRAPARVLVDCAHPKAKRWCRKVERDAFGYLEKLALEDVELSISLVGDRAIRRLNRTWRDKDKATDVLSFPAGELPKGVPGPRPLGDVVISVETAARAAKALQRTISDELERYLAHGLLHLLGYDHERSAAAARKMARMEELLLGEAGMIDEAQKPRG